MNRTQAKIAAEMLCDVFTPDGDAVVIEWLGYKFAIVTGQHFNGRIAIAELQPCQQCMTRQEYYEWQYNIRYRLLREHGHNKRNADRIATTVATEHTNRRYGTA